MGGNKISTWVVFPKWVKSRRREREERRVKVND